MLYGVTFKNLIEIFAYVRAKTEKHNRVEQVKSIVTVHILNYFGKLISKQEKMIILSKEEFLHFLYIFVCKKKKFNYKKYFKILIKHNFIQRINSNISINTLNENSDKFYFYIFIKNGKIYIMNEEIIKGVAIFGNIHLAFDANFFMFGDINTIFDENLINAGCLY